MVLAGSCRPKLLKENDLTEVLRTARLRLRHIELSDAAFLLALLNEPAFIQNIGDRQVRNLDQAATYLQQNMQESYRNNGFGLWVMERLDDQQAIGLCGLVKRDYLTDPDVGYALLAAFNGEGYTSEAALAVVNYANQQLGIKRLCGIVSTHNLASKRILTKIGMQACGQKEKPGTQEWVDFYQLDLA